MGRVQEQLDRDLLELEQALTPESLFERAADTVRSIYLDEHGAVNVKNVAITAGALVALVAIRKIF